MKADYIKEIVGKIHDLPYKAILFDGTWGIGKSYAVNEALEGIDNVCKISMFGLSNASQIYHEVLFQLALKNSIGGRIGKIAKNIWNGLSTVWEKAAQAKDVINSIAKEREVFLMLAKEFNSQHLIIIDDLERIGRGVSLEEVFGIIEELKQCNYVKVILVAHIEELTDENKKLFEKYNEKVIDRIYHITERPQKVNWGKLKIHAGFIEEFLNIHKVKNLRTLQKAQNFYDDVRLYCGNIADEDFLNEVRLICFAIVVECTDNLYYKEHDKSKLDDTAKYSLELNNELMSRIKNYLWGIRSNNNFVEMLLEYYKNEREMDAAEVDAAYKLFEKAGHKPDYLKSDEEIRRLLPKLNENINSTQNLVELNKFADSYMVWSDTVQIDNTSVLETYRKRLRGILENLPSDEKETVLSHGHFVFFIESEKVKAIYLEEIDNMKKGTIIFYIKYLKEKTKGKEAYNYSNRLRDYYDSNSYKDIIKECVEPLYNKKSFPIDMADEKQYHTCFNIMYVLYHADKDKFLKYCDDLIKNCDKMSAKRVKDLTEEIMKTY